MKKSSDKLHQDRAIHELPLQEMISFVEAEISANRSDVVHDILAFLAEQMIEMNKTKYEEIKGFLKWLEREIGADIETLTNKTALKEYYDNDFDSFLNVLKKNKQKLSKDPSNRQFQEALNAQFKKSVEVISPLKNKINATDKLIDQIVYRLYDLTEDEIKTVEKA